MQVCTAVWSARSHFVELSRNSYCKSFVILLLLTLQESVHFFCEFESRHSFRVVPAQTTSALQVSIKFCYDENWMTCLFVTSSLLGGQSWRTSIASWNFWLLEVCSAMLVISAIVRISLGHWDMMMVIPWINNYSDELFSRFMNCFEDFLFRSMCEFKEAKAYVDVVLLCAVFFMLSFRV